jgi:hypothetical protein
VTIDIWIPQGTFDGSTWHTISSYPGGRQVCFFIENDARSVISMFDELRRMHGSFGLGDFREFRILHGKIGDCEVLEV